jgi:hypothetical protein
VCLFPATLLGAAFQVSGNSSKGAIDTLTMTTNTFNSTSEPAAVFQVLLHLDSLAPATASRNRMVFDCRQQLSCEIWSVQGLDTTRVQIDAIGQTITSIKINSQEVTPGGVIGLSDVTYRRNDLGQTQPLPSCGKAPSVSFLGLIALALLLAGFSVRLLRRKKVGAV